MPEERVAIQPPSVEYVKLSGKWPQVQPWAPMKFGVPVRWVQEAPALVLWYSPSSP